MRAVKPPFVLPRECVTPATPVVRNGREHRPHERTEDDSLLTQFSTWRNGACTGPFPLGFEKCVQGEF